MLCVHVDDEFDGPPLPPEWVVGPGRGGYSLTEAPGYLLYIVDAGYVDPLNPGYASPLLLIRPFTGSHWTLTTRITYDLRPGPPTNNRHLYFFIREPGNYSKRVMIKRSIGAYDSNPASNSLSLLVGAGDDPLVGGEYDSLMVYFPNSPNPLPPDTIFYQVERDGQRFVVRVSTDSDDTTFEHELEYTLSTWVWGSEQEIAICGGGWYGAPGGYADLDFVQVLGSTPSQPPVADTGGPYLVRLRESVVLNGSGSTDPDGDVLTYSWTPTTNLDDGSLMNPTYFANTVGVEEIALEVADPGGLVDSDSTYVVVYDPEGGFVTGGGWILSPEGACRYDTCTDDITGKANFGFVSKYKKGATIPTGETHFQLKAGDLNFHSDSYEWLVVAGAKAKYKGVGTINGSGNYGFMISAIDEALTTSTEVDLFRIKIWDRDDGDTVVYDNQMGESDDSDPTTAIGSGNIVVHKAK